MALNSSEGRVMKAFILLLFCCFSSAKSSQITCITNLRFTYGTYSSYYNNMYYKVADDVHEGCCLSCENAQLLCYKNMVLHLNQVLGNGVGYIRDTAAENLCNIVKREIVNTNPMHVYAYWSVSNCPSSYNIMYLGQLCCWSYYVGGNKVYVNNPECSQCQKPDCHPNKTSTSPTKGPVGAEALGGFVTEMYETQTIQAEPVLEEIQEDQSVKDMEARFQEVLEGQKIPLRSRMNLDDQKEEDDESSQIKKDSRFESDFKNFMGDLQG